MLRLLKDDAPRRIVLGLRLRSNDRVRLMERRWRRLDPDEPVRPFGIIEESDIEDDRRWQLDGLVIFRATVRISPALLEPLVGTKLMAAWGMIPRNQG